MSWEDLKDFESDYEIWTEFPYQIRKKSNQRIIKESVHKSDGYIRCSLNGKTLFKHRIIANNFIENPNKYEFIDHINRVRTDNRIENLRWVSKKLNNNNQSNQNFVDEISDDAILVEYHNGWEFEFLYFVPENDTFYVYNGINYNVKPKHQDRKSGYWRICVVDKNGIRRTIYYHKFKREYGLI